MDALIIHEEITTNSPLMHKKIRQNAWKGWKCLEMPDLPSFFPA